ncbi:MULTISPECIES: beta-ketoacyl synthase N-terminal-like domain-containing protein [Nocardia]|uniref:beta-ketoacyl synthase N-terminal-like domain-containing protein n=1 Tax=Nocardia TaxID=1817 RepID=UPI000D6983F4|nr:MULTISPECIES: beta-ketoacyl synthase N-terminal-like domain-containing protein [Nocardia]
MRLNRIGIRGIGAVSGYGWGVDALWKGFVSEEVAAAVHAELGGRFPDPCWMARIPDSEPDNYMGRYTRAYASATEQAIRDATERGWRPGERVAVVTATTQADQELLGYLIAEFDRVEIHKKAYVQMTWTTPAYEVMNRHGYHGPALVVSAACTSGIHAIATAQRLITLGDATDAIVIGVDCGYNAEPLISFHELGPLRYDTHPREICRPLQEGSRGFVIGEAAAALVLSPSLDNSYLTVAGTTMTSEAYHALSIDPTHRMITSSVDQALAHADLTAAEVATYIAHATGTPECNRADEAVVAHLGPGPRSPRSAPNPCSDTVWVRPTCSTQYCCRAGTKKV